MAIRRVSKQGLSGCPSCGQHVKLESAWRETVCPFCDTLITKAAKQRAFPGRGGLLAASLLSVGLVGCDSEDPEPVNDAGNTTDGGGAGGMGGMGGAMEPDPQPAPEPAVQPLYGEPDPQPAPEPAGMPEYGIPPEPEPNPEPPSDAGVDAAVDATVDMALAPDAGPMPEYGAPPVEPDGGEVPLYGIPPMQDAGVAQDAEPPEEDAASSDPDMAEPMPVPLYGIPPERE